MYFGARLQSVSFITLGDAFICVHGTLYHKIDMLGIELKTAFVEMHQKVNTSALNLKDNVKVHVSSALSRNEMCHKLK